MCDDSGAPAAAGPPVGHEPTWPGRLDSVAADGARVMAGESRDAMAAECMEEAGVSEDLLHTLQARQAV